VIDLNALLRRPVEYYDYPWAIEGRFRDVQARLRSLFQAPGVAYIFAKSMPRSGHRFLSECLGQYFGPRLHYCGYYRPDCCHRMPCARPHNAGRTNRYFLQKGHDFGFRDSPGLYGKYLIQYRSPIPRLQSNYDLHARATGEHSAEGFRAFAATETIYFINFYRKWIAGLRPNALAVAYEDLIEQQRQTLAAAIGFVQGASSIDSEALERVLAHCPVGGDGGASGAVRDPRQHPYCDRELFARLEAQVAAACGTDRIRFYFI
jgi:hypothetical protein